MTPQYGAGCWLAGALRVILDSYLAQKCITQLAKWYVLNSIFLSGRDTLKRRRAICVYLNLVEIEDLDILLCADEDTPTFFFPHRPLFPVTKSWKWRVGLGHIWWFDHQNGVDFLFSDLQQVVLFIYWCVNAATCHVLRVLELVIGTLVWVYKWLKK